MNEEGEDNREGEINDETVNDTKKAGHGQKTKQETRWLTEQEIRNQEAKEEIVEIIIVKIKQKTSEWR